MYIVGRSRIVINSELFSYHTRKSDNKKKNNGRYNVRIDLTTECEDNVHPVTL